MQTGAVRQKVAEIYQKC